MREVILNFPKQFKIGQERAKEAKLAGIFSKIILCGIGGSALPGSLINDLDLKISIPLFVHRDYNLPKNATKDSLIIAISFSGNTEETLSAYEQAIAQNYPVIAISTGGKLQELAQKNQRPFVIVPNDCLQPRFGTGYLVGTVLKILANCNLIEDQAKTLDELARNLNPESLETKGKELAEKLVDKVPVIYASNSFQSVALMWKIKFNENSKIMAFWNYFPELNHNEMVGLTNLKAKFHFIILKDETDHERTQKRMELFTSLAKDRGAEVELIDFTGKTKLEKIFSNLILGDWVSYHLALAYGQDPTPVEIVEKFKKALS
ncbi:MAG: bifunctional phosphoglucose/phosphomannose isomerase [Candidatus Gribaldobacteria bacterium]|nr:bifunctional phosphoglucose/phosphomannose isomerase [Candidatus Gribaldobacteria bacterium]